MAKNIKNQSKNIMLVVGIFTICSSALFALMMYLVPTITPPFKLFLFPMVGCLFGITIIFDSFDRKYIAYKFTGISFVLLGITFVSIFGNDMLWWQKIIPALFIIVGLIALFQPYSSKRDS